MNTTGDLIKKAQCAAEKMSQDIRTNQIRNIYSGIIRIKQKYQIEKKWTEDIKKEILKLKPALAYAAGRQNKVKEFQRFLEPEIDNLLELKTNEALENFFTLIESFIAYHKFYGGKD